MRIEKITVGELLGNCYAVFDEAEKEAVLIDPGAEPERILVLLLEKGLSVKYIAATHGHIDHTGAIPSLARGISPAPPVLIHQNDSRMLEDADSSLAGFAGVEFEPFRPDSLLEDGDIIEARGVRMEVIHTPGHTPGSICLRSGGILFSGDTLFAEGVGRTDLPGGSPRELNESINGRILTLDESTAIYPGHGPESTVSAEKRSLAGWI